MNPDSPPPPPLRDVLVYAYKAREIHIQQESDRKINRALKHRVRRQEVQELCMGEKIYYKKDKEDRWRGPARVIGIDGKSVIVKQGSDVREINRIHIVKVNKCGDYFGVKERDVEEEEDGSETETGEEEEEEEGTWVAVREEEEGEEGVRVGVVRR